MWVGWIWREWNLGRFVPVMRGPGRNELALNEQGIRNLCAHRVPASSVCAQRKHLSKFKFCSSIFSHQTNQILFQYYCGNIRGAKRINGDHDNNRRIWGIVLCENAKSWPYIEMLIYFAPLLPSINCVCKETDVVWPNPVPPIDIRHASRHPK